MEELLKQILDELKWQSKQLEKLTLVTADLKRPCGKNVSDVKKILEGITPSIKNNPMTPFLNQLVKLAEEEEKDGK